MAPTEAKIFRYYLYDDIFNLHSHTADRAAMKKNGLSEELFSLKPVEMHSKEKFYTAEGITGKFMNEYADSGIKEIFGISYIEYMNLPYSEQRLMKEISIKKIAAKTSMLDNIGKNLE